MEGLRASDLNHLHGSAWNFGGVSAPRGAGWKHWRVHVPKSTFNPRGQGLVDKNPSFQDPQWDDSEVCSTHFLRGSPEGLSPSCLHIITFFPEAAFGGTLN